jgi:antitoxin MazE
MPRQVGAIAICGYTLAICRLMDGCEKMQKLTRWGNSVGIRIPAHVLGAAGLKSGDHVYVRLMDSGDIRVRPVKGRRQAESESAKTTAIPEPSELEQW